MEHYGLSYQEILRAIGARTKQLRLMRNLRQAELAAHAGIGLGTVHRFEKTGSASLENVLRIAMALHAEQAFDKLFEAPPYASLDEALARPEITKRQRAPRQRRQIRSR
ncbi:MAG TPA: helix-turn-helix transcriptional regulator [Kofleriaceae bacterium]|nr:helix-turn-helix transcriptional regulator [Kofleriaceae bacterium]